MILYAIVVGDRIAQYVVNLGRGSSGGGPFGLPREQRLEVCRLAPLLFFGLCCSRRACPCLFGAGACTLARCPALPIASQLQVLDSRFRCLAVGGSGWSRGLAGNWARRFRQGRSGGIRCRIARAIGRGEEVIGQGTLLLWLRFSFVVGLHNIALAAFGWRSHRDTRNRPRIASAGDAIAARANNPAWNLSWT